MAFYGFQIFLKMLVYGRKTQKKFFIGIKND